MQEIKETVVAADVCAETEVASIPTESRYVAPKRRRRWGDRKDGRRLRTIQPMSRLMPFIMPKRSDACNMFTDSFDVTEADKYCRRMIRDGYTNFNFMHLLIAAYVRAVSQYPAINRYVSGQRIFARTEITVVMTIKKSMKIDEPDTCIKVTFAPDDTAAEIYEKFNQLVQENQVDAQSKSDFDKIMDFFTKFPRLILRGVVGLVKWFDYHNVVLLPDLPFYGSMIITSMGSLGIPAIYHHIYDFGNLPVFLAFGKKYYKLVMDKDGNIGKRRHIDLKVVTDERICDGFYYASAFKYIKKLIEHPEMLDARPEQVVEDID
jgi:hypothetical protein